MNCSAGGSINYAAPVTADPGSPFVPGDFKLQTAGYDQCLQSLVAASAIISASYNGASLSGCPASDPGCSQASYTALGTPDALFQSDLSSTTGQDQQSATTYQISRMDSRYAATGIGRLMLQEQMGDLSYTAAGNPATSAHFNAMLGKQDQPFAMHVSSDGSQLALNGPFAFNSDDLGNCASGSANITTINPVIVDAGGELLGGTLQLSSGNKTAYINIGSDGSWQVTLDGQTLQLDAVALAAAAAGCAP